MRVRKKIGIGIVGLAMAALIGAACTGGGDADAGDAVAEAQDGGGERATQTIRRFDPASGTIVEETVLVPLQVLPEFGPGLNPGFLFLPEEATTTPQGQTVLRGPTLPPVGPPWLTNWEVRIAEPEEFVAVVPRDSIRSLEAPRFDDFAGGNAWMSDDHPVIQVEINGDARAFPLGIISKHEVINTTIGGRALAVTFCPLCNSAIAFERVIEGQIVEFGVSGMLRKSDLVMWDRTTETLWQQLTGEALVGSMVGMKLELLSAPITSWGQFKQAFPDGLVLSVDTGFPFRYELNSYVGYEAGGPIQEYFDAESDPRLRANERVAAIEIDDTRVAYSFEFLRQNPVVNATQANEAIVVVWTPGTASALDARTIDESRDAGATGVFHRELDGRTLTFERNPGDPTTFIDADTGTVWDIFGRGVRGELAGRQLETVVHGNHLWFAWSAFFPDTELVRLAR